MNNKHILLLQPTGDLSKPEGYLCASYLEPITLEYLAAYMEENGYTIEILAHSFTQEEMLKTIEITQPFIIGLSCYTYTFPYCLKLAQAAKTKAQELGYKLTTILGGYHVSANPKEAIAHDEVDFVIQGEGELTFFELCEAIAHNHKLADISGVYYKDNSRIIQNAQRCRINDLDSLPWPKHQKKFLSQAKQFQLIYPPPSEQQSVARVAYSRGCPFTCTFCSSKNIWGQNILWRSAHDVLDEIEMLKNRFGTNLVSFLDLTFNASKKKVLEICDEFSKRNLDVYWWGLFRADLLDEDILVALSQAKCVKLNVGLESPDQNISRKIKTSYADKNHKIIKNLKIASDLGILIKAFIIIGFPEENKDDISAHANQLSNFSIDELRVTFATPLPATSFWEDCLQKGYINQNPEWKTFTTEGPVINHPSLSNRDLLELREKLVSDFYLNAKYVQHVKDKIAKYKFLKKSFLEYFYFIKNNDTIKNRHLDLITLIKTIESF